MNNTPNRIAYSIITVITSIIVLLCIWKGLPLWLDEINPLATMTSLVLLSIIVILSSCSVLFYLFYPQIKLSENPEKDHQIKFKSALNKQKNLQVIQIKQVVHYLMTSFKLMTQKRYRFFRRLPFYLAINAKNSQSQRFFEKCGLTYISTPNSFLENSLNDLHGSLCQWQISNQAVILNIISKYSDDNLEVSSIPEKIWGIQSASHQWLGILCFLRKFRRYRTINGLIITLNLPQFVIQSESKTTEQLKELSKLVQMLYGQFNVHIPVYFVFTQTDAIAGFHEFFADMNAEHRDQPWGIAFTKTRLLTTQQRLNYLEKEFNTLINILNRQLFVRLETEKEMENRAQISCFPQQIELCKPGLKKLVSETSELFLRGIYFVGTAVAGKTVDFAMTTSAIRFGLPLHEPHYLGTKHDYFSKKIISELVLNDVNMIHKNTYYQMFKNMNARFRLAIAAGILGMSSIGFLVSYVHHSKS